MTWMERSQKIAVITKQDLIKILGRSPDKADALILSFANPNVEEVEELQLPVSRANRVYTRVPTRADDRQMTDVPSSLDRPKPYQVRRAIHRGRRVRW